MKLQETRRLIDQNVLPNRRRTVGYARHICESIDAADVSAARRRLAAAARRFRELRPLTNEYYGGGTRTTEPVQKLGHRISLDAIVTRNHYGCLVLNAAHALFIDVDVWTPHADTSAGRQPAAWQGPWRTTWQDLCTVLASEKSEGFRVYRTAAGFRILATRHEFEPDSPDSKQLMTAVGADDAFIALCGIQKSFRARLTPKPWRCGAERPPELLSRPSANERQRFNAWLSHYEWACRRHATCQYLGHIGPEHIHKQVAPIVELHDRETKAFEPIQLA